MRFLYSTELTTDFLYLCKELEKELKDSNYDSGVEIYPSIKPSYDTIITIYDRDIPVGCGSLSPYDNCSGEISGIYIEPSYRREGYTKMLLLQLETIASSIGYKKLIIELNPSLHHNKELYTSLGYFSTNTNNVHSFGTIQLVKNISYSN